ncbi:MAG: hypothetical protein WBO55_10390 [Rhizobiaceae bacterium]
MVDLPIRKPRIEKRRLRNGEYTKRGWWNLYDSRGQVHTSSPSVDYLWMVIADPSLRHRPL